MLKIAVLMKRRAGLSVHEFQGHLQSKYGSLAAKGPGLRRYVQSCALPQGYAQGELLFDAIGEMWFDSMDAYDRFTRSPEFAAAREDENTFLERSRTVVMPLDVYVIKDGPIPAGAVKNIEFVNRRPGMALEPFRSYWREVHGPLAARIPVIRRYEQNHLALSEYAKRRPPRYDGLAVTWFASTADMKRGTTTPEYVATRADEPHFLPDGHLPIIITREHIVVDRTGATS
jgi:uncharacterized protein (TIGR02118 family)